MVHRVGWDGSVPSPIRPWNSFDLAREQGEGSGRRWRADVEGHGRSIAIDGSARGSPTGGCESDRPRSSGALRFIQSNQLPVPIVFPTVHVPCTKFGGAWDTDSRAEASDHACRWAHPAVQWWVAGAGGTQKEQLLKEPSLIVVFESSYAS